MGHENSISCANAVAKKSYTGEFLKLVLARGAKKKRSVAAE
jgi:hypothetical protein